MNDGTGNWRKSILCQMESEGGELGRYKLKVPSPGWRNREVKAPPVLENDACSMVLKLLALEGSCIRGLFTVGLQKKEGRSHQLGGHNK